MNRVATGINSVVEMKNLTVGYGIKEVLTGIQANISRGQFVSLLGPNGVGKTTLLRTLSRHLQKIEGNIFINDRPIES
ncbi:MAG: ABC transporter ATP-binding protein, partial [Deltaproteobacteria bacterium CG06_land_8_20_14_3_00_44_19]